MDQELGIRETKEGILEHQKLEEGWSQMSQKRDAIFLGEYKHKIDDKSRLALPVKYRGALSGGVVITRGLDNCLFVYPKADWQELAEKIARLPLTQAKARAFARLMLSGAVDARLDKQGRVILPEYLQKYASLKKKVTIAGVYNRLEIWSRGRWGRYKKETESKSADIVEELNI